MIQYDDLEINDDGVVLSDDPKDVLETYVSYRRGGVFCTRRKELLGELVKNIMRDNTGQCEPMGLEKLVEKIYRFHGMFPLLSMDQKGKPYSDPAAFITNYSRAFIRWSQIPGRRKCSEDDSDEVVNDVVVNQRPETITKTGIELELELEDIEKDLKDFTILKKKSLLIDFLQFFNYRDYCGGYVENRSAFNRTLAMFGYGSLYLMNFQELAVLASFQLADPGQDTYRLYADIYTDPELRKMIEAGAVYEDDERMQDFTSIMVAEFKKVNRYKDTDPCSARDKSGMSLYSFVRKYRSCFGRVRLSSYRALCDVIMGESFHKIVAHLKTEDRWDVVAMEQTEADVNGALSAITCNANVKEEANLRYKFHQYCRKTYTAFMDGHTQRFLDQRAHDYEKAMRDYRPETIFDLPIACDDCREYLRLKYNDCSKAEKAIIRPFYRGWKDSTTSPSAIPETLKRRWNRQATDFFLGKTKFGTGEKNQNEWILPTREDVDVVLDAYFNRDLSVTKESLLAIIAVCLSSTAIRENWIASSVEAERSNDIAQKIHEDVDALLASVGMPALNGFATSYEFLFLNSIYHTDYRQVYEGTHTYYPLREYIYGSILGKEHYVVQALREAEEVLSKFEKTEFATLQSAR